MRTQWQLVLRTNTNARRLPRFWFGKFSLRRPPKEKPKVSTKMFSSPRGQQNTNTHSITNQRNKSREKALQWSSSQQPTPSWHSRRRPLRRRPPRNGRSFPPSESSQRSINLLRSIVFVYGRSKFYWFFVCATKTDRSFTHTHTLTHVRTQVHRETSNVCIAPIFVPFCDKYLILSFLVFLTIFFTSFSHTHIALC